MGCDGGHWELIQRLLVGQGKLVLCLGGAIGKLSRTSSLNREGVGAQQVTGVQGKRDSSPGYEPALCPGAVAPSEGLCQHVEKRRNTWA